MSEASREGRKQNRAKAMRLAGPGIGRNDPGKPVDASGWKPPEALDAGRKTGARPIRPRIYKHGGKIQGDRAPRNPGKACRGGAMATGGRAAYADGGNVYSVYNTAKDNAQKLGSFHEGGYKRGGMPKAGASLADIKNDVHKHESHMHKGEPKTKLARGGKAAREAMWRSNEKASIQRQLDRANAPLDSRASVDFGVDQAAKRQQMADLDAKSGGKARGGKASGTYFGGTRPTGGRMPRANGGPTYSKEAVDKEIRKDPRIKGREAKAIHRLLKGPTKDPSFSDWSSSNSNVDPRTGEAWADKPKRASGGRAKGKTNISIVIAQPKQQQQQQPMMPPQGPVRPPMPPPQVQPPAGGPPPMPMGGPPPGPPGGMPGGAGPMMRKAGGRANAEAIPIRHAGAGSGEGRLERMAIQKRSKRATGGSSPKVQAAV